MNKAAIKINIYLNLISSCNYDINNLHSVITDYEKEIFKKVLYEEITIKLKKINKFII